MSNWQDIIKQIGMTIVTGDAASYTPHYMTASVQRKKEFNIAQFDFKGIQGSLIKRGTRKGIVYDIEIIFQGANCIADGNAFYASADNPKAWTITHPFYGSIYCHPFNLDQDNSKLNQSILTGQIVETITDAGLTVTTNGPSVVASKVTAFNEIICVSFASGIPVIPVSTLQALINHINSIYRAVSAKIANVQADVTSFNKAYTSALNIANTLSYDTLTIADQMASFLMEPAFFTDSVVSRIGMFNTALSVLNGDISGILAAYNVPTYSQKKLYENNAGVCVAGICLASVNNITTDYNYRPDVLSVIQQIIGAYNGYINNLVLLQSATGGEIDSYIPNATSITNLQLLVNFTLAVLYQISTGAKQQRTYMLPYDDNLINVAYLLYGSDPDDTKKMTFIANNNIQLDEVLVLKKGRVVIYYV